jgi:hypothetical protein
MCNIETLREFYKQCKGMDISDSMELLLSTENTEEQEFISVISDFILQQKQKQVIAQKRF